MSMARITRDPPPNLEHGVARALVELLRSVGEDWDAAIRRMLQVDADTLQVDRVNVWSLQEEGSRLHCDAGYIATSGAFERGATISADQCPEYFAAFREARIINMADVQRDPRCRGLRDYCSSRGISSMLDVPLWSDGRPSGVLCHEHVGPSRTWTAREEDFALGVAQLVASTLSAAAHSRTKAAAQRAGLLDTLSRSLLAVVDRRAVAKRALSFAVPALADLAFFWWKTDGDELELLSFRHANARDQANAEELVRGLRDGVTPALPRRVLRERQAVRVPAFSAAAFEKYWVEPRERGNIERLGLRSLVCVPLAFGGKVFGVLSLFSSSRCYDDDDLSLAEDFAVRIAAALENTRLYGLAQEAIRARDDFLILTAHEVLTPLTALQLNVQRTLRRAPAAAREACGLETIAGQVRRFRDLIERMLEALHIRGEGVTLMTCECDLAPIVRTVVERLAEPARCAGTRIEVGSLATAIGRYDCAKIARMVSELVDNAIKFSDRKPVEVDLRSTDGRVELSVRDHGIGIPEDRLSAIFSPFERAVATEHFGGLGLGLYIARAIAEAHGGSIDVTNIPGDGTRFVARLPGHGASSPATH